MQSDDILMVRLGIHLVHDMLQAAVLADDKGGAQHAHEFAAHELLQAPGAVFLRHRMVLVGKQGEIRSSLSMKRAQFRHRVRTHAQHHSIEFGQRLLAVANTTGLHGAAGRHRLGVKIQHDIFLALELLQTDLAAVLVLKVKMPAPALPIFGNAIVLAPCP